MYDLHDAVALPSVPPTTIPNPWLIQPPTISSIESGTNALSKQGDGTLLAGIKIYWTSLTSTSQFRGNVVDVEAERVTGADLPEVVINQVSAENSSTIISPVKQGETYLSLIHI